jgi:NAD(P)-dependent dehydrogenase (short-subunit alcohol dehydrogenase family)
MMSDTFAGKLALVTGGNSGIGRAITLQLAGQGAEVLLVGRDREKGAAVEREVAARGGRGRFWAIDLAEAEQVRALVDDVTRAYPALHVLVNCAGGGDRKMGVSAASDALERWNKVSGGNFLSAYLVTTGLIDHMPRGGAIVNITSTASLHGNYGLYGAFKAGLEGLTRSWAYEYAPRGLRVNAIAPGWVQVPGPLGTLPNPDDPAQAEFAQSASLLGRMGTPDEIANVALFLASDQASFVTGATVFVDGGLSIIDPTAESWMRALGRKGV